MKKFLSLIALLVLTLTIVGCTPKEAAIVDFSKSQAKTTTIRVWMDDTDGIFMNELIPAFNEVYPNIIVEFQHMATVDSREKLKTFGPSGNGADVFQFPHDHMSQAILEDLVLPLPSDLKERLNTRINEVAMDIATAYYDPQTKSFDAVDGATEQLFAIPISIESIVLYYNKNMINGEDIPTNWEDFIAYGKEWEIQNPGKKFIVNGSHWADSYFLQTLYSSFGWRPFGENGSDADKVGFAENGTASTKLLSAVKWLINTLKPLTTGNQSHNSIGGSYFEEGKAAICLSGPWSVPTYQKVESIDLGAVNIPSFSKTEGTTAENATFAGAQMVCVYKYSLNKEAAIKFCEFLTSDTAAEILYRTSGDCPALKSEFLSNIAGIKDDALIAVMQKQLETSIPMPTIPQVTYYWSPAETLVKNLWNVTIAPENLEAQIITELVKAQESYEASRALAGK